MKNKLIILCLIFFSSSVFAFRIELNNVSVIDFVQQSAPYLAYPVTVSSDVDVNFSVLINSQSSAAYQETFESVLEAHGLGLYRVGELYVIRASDPGIPIVKTLFFKNARAELLAPILENVLAPTKSEYSVSIVPGHNALAVVYMPKYRRLVTQFAALNDVAAKQVYIEAVVFESSVRGLQRLGVDLTTAGSTGLDIVSGLTASGTVGYKIALGDLALDFDAVDSTADVKVISTPSIVVSDGGSGVVDIGKEIPIVTGSVRQEDGKAFQTIDRRSVGMNLTVKPVLVGDQIHLDLKQEVSGIDPDTEASDVVFNRRAISSQFSLADGEGVYLGGLIIDSDQESKKGLPGLSWLPFIGFDEAAQDRTVYSVVVYARRLPSGF